MVTEIITPYYQPDKQLQDINLGRQGTLAAQWIGGIKQSVYRVFVNKRNLGSEIIEDASSWRYEIPLWFGVNPVKIDFIPKDAYGEEGYGEGYGDVSLTEQEIFLERVYVPQQSGVTKIDANYSIEGTIYEDEGYGAPLDEEGYGKVLISNAQTQFPPKLRVKFLTNREISSGVIVNGVERVGYEGYSKYYGSSPLFDDHEKNLLRYDGYGEAYGDGYGTGRTDGYGDGYGMFRDPLRRYGVSEVTIVEGEQIQILPSSKYDVYDEAENQVFVIETHKNERLFLYPGQTLVQLKAIPQSVEEIQIYRERDFIDREPAALPISFDSIRKVLTITPFDSDGYGINDEDYPYARIAYRVAGAETLESDVNNFRITPDGYGVNEDLLEDSSLEFDFVTSLKKATIGLERNYETELLDHITDHKMRMFFFKKNEYGIEVQLNPGLDILHPEKFARGNNVLNPDYYDNGKREIVVRVDYRGESLELNDGDGYGPII